MGVDDPAVPGGRLGGERLLVADFHALDMRRLRSTVRDRSRRAGLAGPELAQFVLAVHEGCANAVLHGGGRGRLVLWRRADLLCCRITDAGPGMPPGWRLEGHRRCDSVLAPRGLWLINQVCDHVELASDRGGTRLLLRFRIPVPAGG
ncbi:ATP-binding protein [Actinoplanes sp. NEAU-A12]|uniref:ATP-binding protein n=1 Tax=Actinoplanes sandaracinus TaxID=3045177 RepID=A0ABT6WNV2_9ACTN|nr:ATP-binding protein [Actinoplanes sandaracinus]MDI6101388.1 ATP-binding protein [Actinoplanes sandaracinus]